MVIHRKISAIKYVCFHEDTWKLSKSSNNQTRKYQEILQNLFAMKFGLSAIRKLMVMIVIGVATVIIMSIKKLVSKEMLVVIISTVTRWIVCSENNNLMNLHRMQIFLSWTKMMRKNSHNNYLIVKIIIWPIPMIVASFRNKYLMRRFSPWNRNQQNLIWRLSFFCWSVKM